VIKYVRIDNAEQMDKLYRAGVDIPQNIDFNYTVWLYYNMTTMTYYGHGKHEPDQDIYVEIPYDEFITILREKKLNRILNND